MPTIVKPCQTPFLPYLVDIINAARRCRRRIGKAAGVVQEFRTSGRVKIPL